MTRAFIREDNEPDCYANEARMMADVVQAFTPGRVTCRVHKKTDRKSLGVTVGEAGRQVRSTVIVTVQTVVSASRDERDRQNAIRKGWMNANPHGRRHTAQFDAVLQNIQALELDRSKAMRKGQHDRVARLDDRLTYQRLVAGQLAASIAERQNKITKA